MSDFCGNHTCDLRVFFWLRLPEDPPVDPCQHCLRHLARVLGVEPVEPLSFDSLHAAVLASDESKTLQAMASR